MPWIGHRSSSTPITPAKRGLAVDNNFSAKLSQPLYSLPNDNEVKTPGKDGSIVRSKQEIKQKIRSVQGGVILPYGDDDGSMESATEADLRNLRRVENSTKAKWEREEKSIGMGWRLPRTRIIPRSPRRSTGGPTR